INCNAGSRVNSLNSIESNSFCLSGPRNTGIFNRSDNALATSAMFAFSAFSDRLRMGRVLMVQTKLGFFSGFLSGACCAAALATKATSRSNSADIFSLPGLIRSFKATLLRSTGKLARAKKSVNLCFEKEAKRAGQVVSEGQARGREMRV